MATVATRATLDDLMRTEGRAELINGEVVQLMANGSRPTRIASKLFAHLDQFCESVGRGLAYADGVGYSVDELTSGRESFQPDASVDLGPPLVDDMKFVPGAPAFAVEVRSENDYGRAAERTMAEKRADYFEAGTMVVWDVDPVGSVIRRYTAEDPGKAEVFRVGQNADAEPALPGWRIPVHTVLLIKPGESTKS